jgi:hypothetical protein
MAVVLSHADVDLGQPVLQIRQASVGPNGVGIAGGNWCWMLWEVREGVQYSLASQFGFKTRRAAVRDFKRFRRLVRSAVMSLQSGSDLA